MLAVIQVEPMTEEFLLWRCLHGGPIPCYFIDQRPCDSSLPWEHYRRRNLPLLHRLTQAYGACAIIARDGPHIVGQLRFYPKAICHLVGAGEMCLQQDHPAGPADTFAEHTFPPLAQLSDKTLVVHCLMTGSPQQKDHPYQRKGLGSQMVRSLIQWATAQGWLYIEANAFEDLPIIYDMTGSAGRIFWEKLGFSLVSRQPHPFLQQTSDFRTILEAQAAAAGVPFEQARDQLVMRLPLG